MEDDQTTSPQTPAPASVTFSGLGGTQVKAPGLPAGNATPLAPVPPATPAPAPAATPNTGGASGSWEPETTTEKAERKGKAVADVVKSRVFEPLKQSEVEKIPGLQPDVVQQLQESGNDTLGTIFGKERGDYVREHILHGFTPEVTARAATKTLTDWYSPAMLAMSAPARIAQGYAATARVAEEAGQYAEAALAASRARLAGLLGTAAGAPIVGEKLKNTVENWHTMSPAERVAAVSGIAGGSIMTGVSAHAAVATPPESEKGIQPRTADVAPESEITGMTREHAATLQKLGYSNQDITNFDTQQLRKIIKGNIPAPPKINFEEAGGTEVKPPPVVQAPEASAAEPAAAPLAETPKASAPASEIKAEGPDWERTHNIIVDGKKVGSVMVKTDPEGDAQIAGSQVEAGMRGLGLAQKAYRSAIEEARAAGATRITSDSTHVSPDANRVWEKLRDKGLPVEEITHPNGTKGYEINFENPATPTAAPEATGETYVTYQGKPYLKFPTPAEAKAWVAENKSGLPNSEDWGIEAKPKTEAVVPPEQAPFADAAKKSNVEFRGIQKGAGDDSIALFQDPQTETSFAVDTKTWTPEKFDASLAKARAGMNAPAVAPAPISFAGLGGLAVKKPAEQHMDSDTMRRMLQEEDTKRGQNGKTNQGAVEGNSGANNEGDNRGTEATTAPETRKVTPLAFSAEEEHPTIAALRDKYGSSENAADMVKGGASFLHPDGTVTDIGALDHPAAIASAEGKGAKGGADIDRVDFINTTGTIRVRHRPSAKAGPEIVFSVPEKGVTPEQVSMMQQAVGKMGRNGNLLIEAARSGEQPSESVRSWPENDVKEFASPADVAPMLRKIGVHPDQAVNKRMTPETAQQIVDMHNENGGSTYNLTHGDMAGTDNYAVSTNPERGQVLQHLPTVQDLQDFAAKNHDLLKNPDKSLGTWYDESNDTHALDVVSTLPDREKAIALGKAHNQKAIYHLKSGETIDTGGTGEAPKDLQTKPESENPPEPTDSFAPGKPDTPTATWNKTIKSIDGAVRKFVASNESFTKILDKTDAKGSTWSAGGCWILADAIQKKFGGSLYAVMDDGVVHHIVTKIGDSFIDADGASSRGGLMNRMTSDEFLTDPTLEKLDPGKVSDEIARPTKSNEIAAALDKHLASKTPAPPAKKLAEKPAEAQQNLPAAQFKIIGGTQTDLEEAVQNTPFASINKDGSLTVNLTRFQSPEAAGGTAARGGVYHLAGEGGRALYQNASSGYGGETEMRGRVTFKNPVIVRTNGEAFGGPMQRDFMKDVLGEEYGHDPIDVMHSSAMDVIHNEVNGPNLPNAIQNWLKKNGGDPQAAYDIWASSPSPHQIATAMWDNVVGQTAKNMGHDAIIGVYAKRGGGLQFSEVFDLTADEFPKSSPPAGATTLLQKNPLLIQGSGAGGRTVLFDVGTALNQWAQQGLKPKKEIRIALDRARAELTYQMAENDGGTSWYKKDVNDAIGHLQQNGFPELEKPLKEKLFRTLLGITSYGVDPDMNMTSAAEAWKQYKSSGTIPLTANEKTNWPGYSGIKGSITLLNKLVNEKGEQGAMDWLLSEHPISELREQKLKTHATGGVPGQAADTKYGAMIFGPKAGAFVLSLQGIADQTVVDVWGARLIRRWTGKLGPEAFQKSSFAEMGGGESLVDAPVTTEEATKFHGIVKQLAEEFGLDNGDAQAVLWSYEHDLYKAHGVGEAAKSYKGAAEKYVQRQQEGNTQQYIQERSGLFGERYGSASKKTQGGGKDAPTGQGAKGGSKNKVDAVSLLKALGGLKKPPQ